MTCQMQVPRSSLCHMKRVIIHTDGACKGNPGPGGYGAVLVCGKHRKEVAQGYQLTTNNRMELRAAIAALGMLTEPCEVELHSDSKYLVQAISSKWIDGWQRRGWITSDKKPVKNEDLWRELDEVARAHDVEWVWVRGHAGHPENERADALANRGISQCVPAQAGCGG